MNKEGWNKIYNKTNKLTKPSNKSHLISNKDIIDLELLIKDVLVNFLKQGNVHLGLKIYINNVLRNDVSNKMLSNIPSKDISLEDWSKIIFGEEKFGIILNSLEQYSNDLSEKAATIVKPLLEIAGLPLGGLSFIFFMGNYGYTPFGIHKEATGEEGFLFHLGPKSKQFYTWDDPKLNTIKHNTEIFKEIDIMIPKSKCYHLNSGDAMFIPHQVYHIANTSEFSMSFVMDYINPTHENLEINLMKSAENENNNTLTNEYHSPLTSNIDSNEWSNILNKKSLFSKLETSLKRHIYSLKSNGGILKKSIIVNSSGIIPNGSFSIKGKEIFPIFYEKILDEKLLLFARGHQFKLNFNENIPMIINKLNNGEILNLDFIRETLEPKWQITDIFSFIGDLLRVEAIVVNH